MRAFGFALLIALGGLAAPVFASPLAGRNFDVVTIGGAVAAVGGKTPTFLIEDARVTGTGGCNNYGAPVTDRGRVHVERRKRRPAQRIAKGPLRVGPVSATRMFCGPGSAQEAHFFNVLGQVRGYRMGRTDLKLYSGGRRPRVLMVLRASN